MFRKMEEELFGRVLVETDIKPSDVATISALFDSQGWELRYAGTNPMLTAPVYEGKHFYLPDWLDNTTIIPQEGLQRLNAVKELGIEIQGIIIGHEAKKLKFGNIVEIDWFELDRRVKETAAKTKEVAIETTKTTLKVLGGLLGGLAYLTGSILSFAVAAIPALLADPLIIIVLEDETNLEIYWWLD